MIKHLVFLVACVDGSWRPLNYAICGSYGKGRTTDPAKVSCKRCLASRAWAGTVANDKAAPAEFQLTCDD